MDTAGNGIIQKLFKDITDVMIRNECFNDDDINKIKTKRLRETLAEIKNIISNRNETILKIKKRINDEKAERLQRGRQGGYYIFLHNNCYYVKYRRENTTALGSFYPTKYSTRTNNYDDAELFAITEKDNLLKKYFNRETNDLTKALSSYYSKNSKMLARDTLKNQLNDKYIKRYDSIMKKYFIPFFSGDNKFLKTKRKSLAEIKRSDLNLFREYMKDKGLSSKTINSCISGLRRVLIRYNTDGIIQHNVLDTPLDPIKNDSKNKRNPFDYNKNKDVFKNEWENHLFYVTILTEFNTGMRNSELAKICFKHIEKINDMYFINMLNVGTKTEAAKRYIPIHNFVYNKLAEWKKENNFTDEDFLFRRYINGNAQSEIATTEKLYPVAAKQYGELLGYTPEEMKENNITFYGLRHGYKTLLDDANIQSAISEYYMGHSLSGVQFSYSHKQCITPETAKPVIKVFDKYFN